MLMRRTIVLVVATVGVAFALFLGLYCSGIRIAPGTYVSEPQANLRCDLTLHKEGDFVCTLQVMAQSKPSPKCHVNGTWSGSASGVALNIQAESLIYPMSAPKTTIQSPTRDILLPVRGGKILVDSSLTLNPPGTTDAPPLTLSLASQNEGE